MKRDIATWTRWLHIYLSMFSFAALLFFAITGLTLNHTEWITGQQKVEQIKGQVNEKWVATPDTSHIDKLAIVEYFRNTYNIKSKLTDFVIEESECSVSFKGPGYAADVFIDRATGSYELTITKSGLLAIMNDLHKGRDAGTTWSAVIDISAVLMILVSLTGFVMIFFLKKKRLSGLLISLMGGVIILILYYVYAQ